MLRQTESPLWEATSTQNLIRYQPSGTYFARFKVGGRLIRQSLHTTVYSVAKQRLPDKMREFRSRYESVKAFANGKMTVNDASQAYLTKIDADISLKPGSKAYYRMLVGFIGRTWPSLFESDVRKISERDCAEWLARYQKHYAPTVINNSIAVLRGIFKEAIDTGARYSNPTAGLERVKVLAKRLELPSREKFLEFVEAVRTCGEPQASEDANLVRLLAYSGMRRGEARHVKWRDVNFDRNELHVRGDPMTFTKNGETRRVPMIPELKQMLQELRAERTNEPADAAIMRVWKCEQSMTLAAEKVGMARITHHDLRHLFATICMRTYGHLRQEHSFEQAQRVSYGVSKSPGVKMGM
jgi:integrase